MINVSQGEWIWMFWKPKPFDKQEVRCRVSSKEPDQVKKKLEVECWESDSFAKAKRKDCKVED